ncbi:MAG: hypothetical protein DMF83_08765 [Acidobacteria bacterium]|nr:MAG: hypothetical protein DMF83_08765 [Acidobacteriota bacterium]
MTSKSPCSPSLWPSRLCCGPSRALPLRRPSRMPRTHRRPSRRRRPSRPPLPPRPRCRREPRARAGPRARCPCTGRRRRRCSTPTWR